MPRQPNTKQRIERVALALFARKGVDATTTKDLAAGAGISEGAIYRHFVSKDALVWALFSASYFELARRLDAVMAATPRLGDRVGRVVDVFCGLFDADRDLFSFLLLSQHGQLTKLTAEMPNPVAGLSRLFAQAAAADECAREDPDLLAGIALGILLQPATFTVYGRLTGPLGARAEALTAAILRAVGAR